MATRLFPPGPKGSFLTGNLREYARDQLGFLTRCAREYISHAKPPRLTESASTDVGGGHLIEIGASCAVS